MGGENLWEGEQISLKKTIKEGWALPEKLSGHETLVYQEFENYFYKDEKWI